MPFTGGVLNRWLLQFARSRVAYHAWVGGGYLLLASALTYPVAFHLSTHIPIAHQIPGWAPGDGDPWHSLWVLWFTKYSLFELGRLPFSTDTLFYPRGADLMYLTLVVFSLILSLPLVQLVGVIAAYNLLILFSLASAGYATFLLVHHLTKDGRAAFVSGLIFAFSPYPMIHSLEHLFLLMSAACLPLYVLFLIKGLREGGTTSLALTPAFFLLTMFSNPYYAIFLLLFTGIYVPFRFWQPEDMASRKALIRRFALVVAALAFFLSLPIGVLALLREWTDTVLYTPLSDVNMWSADLLAFFIPSSYHPLWGGLVKPIYERFTGNIFEQTVYVGYVVLVLSLVAVLNAHKEDTRFWSLSAIAFFVLSLGPFLHINGRYLFTLDGMTLTFSLPSLLFHFVPVLRGARVASRFAVMLMLSLAVLVGYGARFLFDRFDRGRWGARGGAAFLGILSVAILFEFLSLPLPILDARIPKLYEEMGREGSLLELPLDWRIAKYQYYQTAHRKRLLMGFGPRPSRFLVEHADSFPFISLFKNPELIAEYEQRSVLERDVLRFIEFFDLSFIVLHRDYLGSEVFDRLERFLLAHFPILHVEEEGSIVALQLARHQGNADLWREEGGLILDFGSTAPQFFLFEGWSSPERLGERTFAWADAKESRLWVFLPRREDLLLELGLLPLTFPGSPPQGIKISVNERFVREIQLEAASDWQSYTVHLPRTYLTVGVNTIRFVYRYMASPSKVVPGNPDLRRLAVAFDFIAFRPE